MKTKLDEISDKLDILIGLMTALLSQQATERVPHTPPAPVYPAPPVYPPVMPSLPVPAYPGWPYEITCEKSG